MITHTVSLEAKFYLNFVSVIKNRKAEICSRHCSVCVVTPDEIDTALPVLSIGHIQYEAGGLNGF